MVPDFGKLETNLKAIKENVENDKKNSKKDGDRDVDSNMDSGFTGRNAYYERSKRYDREEFGV